MEFARRGRGDEDIDDMHRFIDLPPPHGTPPPYSTSALVCVFGLGGNNKKAKGESFEDSFRADASDSFGPYQHSKLACCLPACSFGKRNPDFH
jgi:hypothetical protein